MTLLATLATALVLPGFTPLASSPAGGEVLTGVFPGTARPGYIYLPPGFDETQRYPVVYLLHGMPGSPSEYLSGTQLPAFADESIASHRLRPFIAVIPAAGEDRAYNGEWAGPWERGLLQRTIPWVDTWLPTNATRAGRVIAGLSAGGYGAVDIGMRHPGTFGAIESWSGYFTPLHDGPFKTAGRAELAANDPMGLAVTEKQVLTHARTRFFLSSGPSQREGLPVELRLYADRRGEWRQQLDAGLRWAFRANA
jgi:enterochelin esterase-like enzyme